MVVKKVHALLLLKLGERWEEGLPLQGALDALTRDELEALHQMDLAGLVREEKDRFSLTYPGFLVLDTLREAMNAGLPHPREWDEGFRWLGSEVISMLEVARRAQGRVGENPLISQELERRFLARNGALSPLGESILEAYQQAHPRVFIDEALAGAVRKSPPGPGRKSLLPLEDHHQLELEAMRLLTYSLPCGYTYSFTGPGQQIRAALLKGVSPVHPIDHGLLRLLIREDDLGEEDVTRLMAMGVLDDEGHLLPGGVHLRKAAQLLFTGPITMSPSIHLSAVEVEVLGLFPEAAQSIPGSPSGEGEGGLDRPLPLKELKEFLAKASPGLSPRELSRALYTLESFRLVDSRAGEEGLHYSLTPLGRGLLPLLAGKGISARGVMAITTTRMEHLSPGDTWCEVAEREGLVGRGYPTKLGRQVARIASTVEPWPLVSGKDARVLSAMPLWHGVFEDEVLRRFPGEEEEARESLERLVAQGILELLPGGLYHVTPIGEKFKRALASVPSGMEFPLNPHVCRFLRAVEEVGEPLASGKVKLAPGRRKEVERLANLDPDTYRDAMVLASQCRFFLNDALTPAGTLVLEGMALLRKAKTEWEEVEV